MPSPKFALAENRQAYASWCGRNGLKQNHAVYLRSPERLDGLSLNPEQVIIIDGWQKNPRGQELHNALTAAAA